MKRMPMFAATLFALTLSVAAQANDALRAALEASKASGKGLTFHVQGAAIPAVVVSVDDKFVVAKSQQAGHVVIRIERIDAVSGFVEVKK